MFAFTFDDFPRQQLEVGTAIISLYAQVPPWRNRIGLYVEVTAKPVDVAEPANNDLPYTLEPRFYTEWLEIPLSALKGNGLSLLDGYRMVYNRDTEERDGFDQHPGAIYQDTHTGFVQATMSLSHVGGGKYRIQADGKTDFGWIFNIDTTGMLTTVTASAAVDGDSDGDGASSSDAVAAWFAKHFDATAFPPVRLRRGANASSPHVLQAKPAVAGAEKWSAPRSDGITQKKIKQLK